MIRTMKAGSVIVDMAAEAGGNCEITLKGDIVRAKSREGGGLFAHLCRGQVGCFPSAGPWKLDGAAPGERKTHPERISACQNTKSSPGLAHQKSHGWIQGP